MFGDLTEVTANPLFPVVLMLVGAVIVLVANYASEHRRAEHMACIASSMHRRLVKAENEVHRLHNPEPELPAEVVPVIPIPGPQYMHDFCFRCGVAFDDPSKGCGICDKYKPDPSSEGG